MSTIEQYNEIKNSAVSRIDEIEKLQIEIKEQLNINMDLTLSLESIRNDLTNTMFTVAVVGVIKRGKSTLLNAILGDKLEILSTSVTPETAKLSYIIYDENPFAIIHKNDESSEKISLEELDKYTSSYSKTKLEFRHKHKGVKELVENTKYAEIHYPNKYLKNGVVFVDTPGVDDPDETRSKVTEEFINKADAVIFLVDVLEGGLKESELKFLKTRVINRKNSKGIICACNKILALRRFQKSQLDDVLISTKVTLEKELNIIVPVFPIDAKAAYDSKLDNNTQSYEDSKFDLFLEGLEKTLIDEKGRIVIKKGITNLTANVISPIIEALKFKLSNKPSDLNRIISELEKLKEKTSAQKTKIDKFRVEFGSEKTRLKTKVESEIRIEFGGIVLDEKVNITQLENNIVRIVESLSGKMTNMIRQTFSKLLAEINAYEIRLPAIELIVDNPNFSADDFYTTTNHTSQLDGASLMGAGIGAAAVGFIFATGGLGAIVLGAIGGFLLGSEVEKTQFTTTRKELDIMKVKNKLNSLTNKIIESYNASIDLYFNQFQHEINNWFSNQENEIKMKESGILEAKTQKESEYNATVSKTEIRLEKAQFILESTNNLLVKLEQL